MFRGIKNKKLSIIFTGILILFIGIEIGIRYSRNNNFNQTSEPTVISEARVVRVIDGDTIEIEGGERVRYIGIDAPETVEPQKPVECFGSEASDKNKELVAGKTVRLEKDTTDRDKYNRLLRYVYVDETLVNAELVKQGFARAWAYPPDVKYQDQIDEAEQAAKKIKSGLWTACSAQ